MNKCPPRNDPQIEALFAGFDNPEDLTHRWECPNVSWQSSPMAITSVITKLVSQYLGDPTRFPNETLRNMLIASTPVVRQLDNSDPKTAGQLPKIVIEFEGSAPVERDFGKNNRIDYNIHNSKGTYYSAWNVQNKVDIVAKTKHEAMLLAEALCFLFAHYKTVIMKILQCHDFRVTRFTGAKLVNEELPDLGFKASLDLITIAPDGWHLVEAAPRLKRVIATTT